MAGNLARRPRVETYLEEICLFVASDNITAADRPIDRICNTFQMLAENPQAGRQRPELGRSIRSFAVGNYGSIPEWRRNRPGTAWCPRQCTGRSRLSCDFQRVTFQFSSIIDQSTFRSVREKENPHVYFSQGRESTLPRELADAIANHDRIKQELGTAEATLLRQQAEAGYSATIWVGSTVTLIAARQQAPRAGSHLARCEVQRLV
ncbi:MULTISPECIES: type II toxin-antitoxin system RelE/ParE family toxin [unclassified Bradyrhizobium]